MKMLRFMVLAIAATLCLSQEPGDYDYIACDDCRIPDGEYPEEGYTVCFKKTTVEKTVPGRVWKCQPPVKCSEWDIFCVPQEEKCSWESGTISVPECKLQRKIKYKAIDQSEDVYQIYSPRYFGYNEYPNDTYCVWNVANKGLVSYQIVDQKLQEPSDCDAPSCDCPDNVKITMGSNEIKLCGSDMPTLSTQFSDDGLQVKFCSDNTETAKGFHLLAYRLDDEHKQVALPPDVHKREITASEEQLHEASDNSSREVDHVTCQYEYMMRLSQPDVPCPNAATIQTMLQYHEHLMSVSSQNSGMCNGMAYPSSTMPMMNKIETCAVEYLYRTRDCEFAKKLVNSANGELRSVARAVVDNDFLKSPKWMDIPRKNCKKDDH